MSSHRELEKVQGLHYPEIERLRIGVIGPAREDDFAWEIGQGLNQLGHEATLLGSSSSLKWSKSRRLSALRSTLNRDPGLGPLLSQRFAEQVVESKFDMVVTVESLRPEMVSRMTNAGIPVCLWFPDHVANLGSLWMFSAPYNAIFFKEPRLVSRMNALLDLPIHYLPEACLPTNHRPIEGPSIPSIAVVGNMHPIRIRLLERLHRDGVPLALYGPMPGVTGDTRILTECHTGEYLRGARKSQVMRNSLAVLNNLHPAEIDGMNKRLFEGAACGGAVVCEWRKTLDDFFEVGSEVLAYSTYDELLARIAMVTQDPIQRTLVGDAASLRAHAQHSYAQRLPDLITKTLSS